MNKKIVLFLSTVCAVLLIVIGAFLKPKENKIEISKVLAKEEYSYLPKEAQEYIKKVYEETGNVVKTEKNKKANMPYLNPQYIEYLELSEEEKENMGEIPMPMTVDYLPREYTENINLPSSYDLRNVNGKNYVTPIRDQGDLGICWAFASAGAIESHLLKTSDKSYSSSSQLISERQIDYATSRNGISDYKNEYVSFINRSLGDGGNFYISTMAMASGISLVDYKSFKPYNDTDLNKMELSDVLNFNDSSYELNSTIIIPSLDLRESTSNLTEEEIETRDSYLKDIKQNIIENGAAYVSTLMNSSCQFVDSNLNNLVIDVFNCNATGGHAMEIIGWDDEAEYSYCADTRFHNSDTTNCKRIVNGKGVWILKNSWGDDTEYPYLTYDSLYTTVAFVDELESSENKNWDNNYVLGTKEEIENKTYKIKDLDNSETIKKVKFIGSTYDTTYTVTINGKNNKTYSISKTNEMPGLITIDFDQDIAIDSDTRITIDSDGAYYDYIIFFTSNISKVPTAKLDIINELIFEGKGVANRVYSKTKNIPSDSVLTYKLLNAQGEEIEGALTVENNIVAENNINTTMTVNSYLGTGNYQLSILYNNEIVASKNITITAMEGDGTKESPYQIKTPTHLYQIRNDLDAYYELANDIDLTEATSENGKLSLASTVCPQGFGWESIKGFAGSLDGKGHSIIGLRQDNAIRCNVDKEVWTSRTNTGNGLFATASGNVTIKNLILDGFDISCNGNYCASLLGQYTDDNATEDKIYEATFENIAIINSKIKGSDYSINTPKISGGLFGQLLNYYGNTRISNIYIDINMSTNTLSENALLVSYFQANVADVNDIRILGRLDGKYDDGSGDAILISDIVGRPQEFKLYNTISTVIANKVGGSLLGSTYINIDFSNINTFKIDNRGLCYTFNPNLCLPGKNVFELDKDTELSVFTDPNTYAQWDEFDKHWKIENVDGIPRIPVLKFMDFEYTYIPDIVLNQELNKSVNLFDYITPKIDAAKNIVFKSNDESIVTIEEDGTLVPQSTGTTSIHVESYYDGYIKDVPITVNYIPHYTIYFDANTGTGEMDSIEVSSGESLTLPENKYEKEYYMFTSWNTKADGTGDSYENLDTINDMPDKTKITLYAQWLGEERVVTLDANGGVVEPDKITVHYGGTYEKLPIPVRNGYAFGHWVAGDAVVDSLSEIRGYALKATWHENAFNIIYEANGGIISKDAEYFYEATAMSQSMIIDYHSYSYNYETINNYYEKEGYIFKEWNTKPDGSGVSYKIKETVSSDNIENELITLYAIWEEEKYTISFDKNGGLGNMDALSLKPTETALLPKNTFNREGYTFDGWNTKADGTGLAFTNEQEIKINEDITLYAQWKPLVFKVTFNSNGGNGNMNFQEIEYDSSIELKTNSFTKEGYTFSGWNTKADGTGTSYTDEQSISLSDNLTLYAQWQINQYNLTYDYNGINVSPITNIYDYNTAASLANCPYSREGYIFTGWNTKADGSGTAYNEYQELRITNDLTLYAQWQEGKGYSSNYYNLDTNKGYVNNISINTNINDYKNSFNLISGYTIDVDYKLVNNVSVLYTGGHTKIYNNGLLINSFVNIVSGDTNGDGKMNYLDYVNVYNHIQKEKHPEINKSLLDGAYKVAGDMSSDNKISYLDYVRIYNKIKELKGGTN